MRNLFKSKEDKERLAAEKERLAAELDTAIETLKTNLDTLAENYNDRVPFEALLESLKAQTNDFVNNNNVEHFTDKKKSGTGDFLNNLISNLKKIADTIKQSENLKSVKWLQKTKISDFFNKPGIKTSSTISSSTKAKENVKKIGEAMKKLVTKIYNWKKEKEEKEKKLLEDRKETTKLANKFAEVLGKTDFESVEKFKESIKGLPDSYENFAINCKKLLNSETDLKYVSEMFILLKMAFNRESIDNLTTIQENVLGAERIIPFDTTRFIELALSISRFRVALEELMRRNKIEVKR